MSLRQPFLFLASRPTITALASAATLVGLPFAQAATLSSSLSTTVLGILNAAGFAINVSTVSIPGRLDGRQDEAMRGGNLNPNESTPLSNSTTSTSNGTDVYNRARNLSLVTPAGWAFAIWGPIYVGEAIFCTALFLPSSGLASLAPAITAPFVAANLFQTFWCASFRPESFNGSWTTMISPLMLAGTAYSLSMINAMAAGNWFLVPITLHFGWTTAATLVNMNSSLAAFHDNDSLVTATGHASVVAATALGVGVTLAHATPAYGLTLAWALTACGNGISQPSSTTAANVQKYLCWGGAAICAATSTSIMF